MLDACICFRLSLLEISVIGFVRATGIMPTILRASDAIYQRASWAWWSGGRIITNRQQGSAINISVDDLIASDPFPTLNAISLDLQPGAKSGSLNDSPATLRGVTISNFHVRNFSTFRSCPPSAPGGCGCTPKCTSTGAMPYGIPNILTAGPDKSSHNISGLAFVNCSIGGVEMAELFRTAGAAVNVSWEFVEAGAITVDGKTVSPTL